MKKTFYPLILIVFLLSAAGLHSQESPSYSISQKQTKDYHLFSFGVGGGYQTGNLVDEATFRNGYEGLVTLQFNLTRVTSLFVTQSFGKIRYVMERISENRNEMINTSITSFGAKLYMRTKNVAPFIKLGIPVIIRDNTEGIPFLVGLGADLPILKNTNLFLNLDVMTRLLILADSDPNYSKSPKGFTEIHLNIGVLFF